MKAERIDINKIDSGWLITFYVNGAMKQETRPETITIDEMLEACKNAGYQHIYKYGDGFARVWLNEMTPVRGPESVKRMRNRLSSEGKVCMWDIKYHM